MSVTPETLLRFLANDQSAADRATTEQALADSEVLRQSLARIRQAVATVREDGSWFVPASAILAAKELGRRLESLRPSPFVERVAHAIDIIVARLTFDSRAEGALAGLRGGTGFALGFDCGEVDIDIECGLGDDERVRFAGQIHGPHDHGFTTIGAFGPGQDSSVVASANITADGMFRLELRPGTYRFRFEPVATNHAAIELPPIEIP